MDKERVWYFVFLTFIIFEPRTVIKRHFIDDDFSGDWSLWIFFMTDFNFRLSRVIKCWFETIILYNEFGSAQERHDCTFSDTGVTNHDNSVLVVIIDRNGLNSCMDENFEFVKVNRVRVFVHFNLKIINNYFSFSKDFKF